MAELRPQQRRGKPKKLTGEVLRNNPLLLMLARARSKEMREIEKSRKASELDLD